MVGVAAGGCAVGSGVAVPVAGDGVVPGRVAVGDRRVVADTLGRGTGVVPPITVDVGSVMKVGVMVACSPVGSIVAEGLGVSSGTGVPRIGPG